MKKLLILVVMLIFTFSFNAKAASISDYAGRTYGPRTSCSKLAFLWNVTRDHVGNDNQVWLVFGNKGSAHCDTETFLINELSVYSSAESEIGITAMKEDMGKKRWQLIRKYGQYYSNGTVSLEYRSDDVDVIFFFDSNTETVNRISLDWRRQIADGARDLDISERKKDELADKLVDLWTAAADYADDIVSREGGQHPQSRCLLHLKSTIRTLDGNKTLTHLIELGKLKLNPDFVDVKVMAIEGVKSWLAGGYMGDSNQYLYFGTVDGASEAYQALEKYRSLCL